jgi:hypothetical protein
MGANKSIERWLADSPGGVPSPTPVARSIPEALVKPPEPKTEEAVPPPAVPEARLRLLPGRRPRSRKADLLRAGNRPQTSSPHER